jgi:hypothetical protein
MSSCYTAEELVISVSRYTKLIDVNNRKNIVLVGCLQRKKQSPHHSKKRLKLNEQVQNRMFSTLVTKCGGI